MKFLAETTGSFGLIDLSTGQSIKAHRPTVITRSSFIDSRIALSQILKVADVPDEATDDDFQGFWIGSDGDRELAIASFLSTFEPEAEPAAQPAARQSKPRGGK